MKKTYIVGVYPGSGLCDVVNALFHHDFISFTEYKIVKTYSPKPKQKRKMFRDDDGLPIIDSSSSIARNQYIKMYDKIEGVNFDDPNIPFDLFRHNIPLY